MQNTEKHAFAEILYRTWRFKGKDITPEAMRDWWEILKGFELNDIAAAFQAHLLDPEHGQYLPMPADIARHLTHAPNDGRPAPEEAWGMLVRLITDEAETGVITEEMRRGWEACGPIMDLGDNVGARRCFLEVYQKCLGTARRQGVAPRWTVTLGTDPAIRAQRLQEAAEAGRIGVEHATALLPGPGAASIGHVATLLEGPDASEEQKAVAHSLRELAQILRAGKGCQERVDEERQQRANEEAAKKRQIEALLQEHNQSHQKAS